MLQSMTWIAVDNLARNQLQLFRSLGEELRLSEEERRHALQLSPQQWAKWTDFLDDGDLPAEPSLPVMLQRLGTASYRLSLLAEAAGVPA